MSGGIKSQLGERQRPWQIDKRKESDPGVGMRNQKTWIDSSIVSKLKKRDAAYKQGKVTGGKNMVKQYKYDLNM